MAAIYRQCPVCRAGIEKRSFPEKFKNFANESPEWFAYECMNCGSVLLVQPFVMLKAVAKG